MGNKRQTDSNARKLAHLAVTKGGDRIGKAWLSVSGINPRKRHHADAAPCLGHAHPNN